MGFKDIYLQGFGTQSPTEDGKKYMNITLEKSRKRKVLEKLPKLPSGLHHTYI